jgi:hypothetical protein
MVAIVFAERVSDRVDGTRLRDIWRPVVSSWEPPRLVWALGTVRIGRNAVDAVLARLQRRKERLPEEFRKLYFTRSHKLW